MLQSLTPKQKEVLDYIIQFINDRGYAPSFREIADGLALASPSTVHVHIQALRSRGFLKSGGAARELEPTDKAVRWGKSVILPLAGLITGIAASFSMAASEYLSKKQESDSNALKASFYTGTAYIGTVLFLVFPYLILSNYLWSLSWTLANAAIIIFIFTYFNSVTKDLKFKKLFWEMIAISFGVAVFSFGVGLILRMWFGIEV